MTSKQLKDLQSKARNKLTKLDLKAEEVWKKHKPAILEEDIVTIKTSFQLTRPVMYVNTKIKGTFDNHYFVDKGKIY